MTVRFTSRVAGAFLATAVSALVVAAAAAAAITPTPSTSAGATTIGGAIVADPALLAGASYVAVPGGTPNGIANAPIDGFPTNGPTFGILTTGNVDFADDANSSGATGADLGGPTVRGNSDVDVTILKLDLNVPQGANCLTLDFKFFSEEYPEWLNSQYNDAFIAEYDASTWTTSAV